VSQATVADTPAGGALAAPPALSFERLSKTFGGQKALDQASLSIRVGEVHGLLGQNGSGKSTLIKILAGFHEPDPGSIFRIRGEEVALPMPPGGFRRYHISFVHQHLGLIPTLTVLDNLMLGRLAGRPNWAISWRHEAERASAVFRRYGIDLDPRTPVQQLSPVERALLAIVRAVDEMQDDEAGDSDAGGVLVLDEPTPFLPRQDVDRLFDVVRTIVARGASVIFVSHDVDEVMEITNRATVLRDGRVAGTLVTNQSTKTDFVEKIVGRKFTAYSKSQDSAPGEGGSISIVGLAGGPVKTFDAILRRGEVVGLTGLVGSGYAAVPYLLYGAQPADAGALDIGGGLQPIPSQTPADSIDQGIVLIPGDRANAAAIGALSITDNVTMPVLTSAFSRWQLARRRMTALAEDLGRRFEVLPNRPDLPISALSGGNQQKVMLAKWMQQSPVLVLLDEPTQGVDIGARQAVFAQIAAATRRGASVLCASSDYEQLEAICDRVLIFADGKVTAELTGDAVSKAAIAERCYGANQPASLTREVAA
jgi:ribose transport system ATP-binding protein